MTRSFVFLWSCEAAHEGEPNICVQSDNAERTSLMQFRLSHVERKIDFSVLSTLESGQHFLCCFSHR